MCKFPLSLYYVRKKQRSVGSTIHVRALDGVHLSPSERSPFVSMGDGKKGKEVIRTGAKTSPSDLTLFQKQARVCRSEENGGQLQRKESESEGEGRGREKDLHECVGSCGP